MFENPRRGRQARNFTTNVPKILDLKSSSEQMFSKNCRWVPLIRGVSNDNGDCNENMKTNKFNQQNKHAFWYISLPSLHAGLRRETS